MWTFVDFTIFLAGFAACWLCKDKITQTITGTEAFAKALETKATALKALL